MKEYIEREAVLKYAEAMYELAKKHAESMRAGSGFWRGWYNMLADERKSVVEFLENLPTADVAPVVYCRKCKNLVFSDCYGECGRGYLGIVRPDDFCSRGERKADD